MPLLQVTVKPNARASAFGRDADGLWRATLKAAPMEGRANAELIKLVARHFGCRAAQVSIKSGAGARVKLLHIDAAVELPPQPLHTTSQP